MEQQVKSEIDQLFQELIVAKILESIAGINSSLDSLLGEESEIQFKLKQIPTNGGLKSILTAQLQGISEQTAAVGTKLDDEKKKLAAFEAHVKAWLKQISTTTTGAITGSETNLKEYADSKKDELITGITSNCTSVQTSILTDLTQTKKDISSEIDGLQKFVNDLFMNVDNEDSFRKTFDSEMQKLSDKLLNCENRLAEIVKDLSELSDSVKTGNLCLEGVKKDISVLMGKADTLSEKTDIQKLQESIEENAKKIDAISNADIIEIVQKYKAEMDSKLDTLKMISISLTVANVIVLIAMVMLFIFK